ncbi:hypothetical protein I6N90_05760 [Paenibacillus sp. GSMTC-2017]|uniref:hypothetical protein n=1 Tax=Paenibacillus sp. GSMTC-2017 TaxID=2794350 RepID=UPI0018D88FEA|nr:hypothetical protein [Paenibacillus sp. GSMTC-2017]MBH5317317.1 hypothetical protein [Paenibacillus sp. GSMTC-2017]
MEFLEVVFNLRTVYLDKLLFDEFKLTADNIKSSHFYDNDEERDKEFHEIASFSDFFTKPATGTITVKELQLGTVLEEFLIVFSFNEEFCTIDINFSESDWIVDNILDKKKCLELMEYFLSLMERYHIESVRFGYEPATDDDTCLIELKAGVTQMKDIVNRL